MSKCPFQGRRCLKLSFHKNTQSRAKCQKT
eukprot:UN19000